MFYKKLCNGDKVLVKKTSESGIVKSVLPHPFTPDWMDFIVKPNYLVMIDGEESPEVYKRKELKKL